MTPSTKQHGISIYSTLEKIISSLLVLLIAGIVGFIINLNQRVTANKHKMELVEKEMGNQVEQLKIILSHVQNN